ncbi:MAG TPA: TraX family protein [Candidatus Saccharimonadales bacterium]|nr:TraX family protein [Candidatus Saccharimonadales bacterium]
MKQINIFGNSKIIDAFTLKVIAVVTMLVDHIGFLIFPDQLWLREIGRLALPLFAFLLAQGLLKTSSVKNYLLRLMVFALISQIPYSLASYLTGNNIANLNIFFLLALGLGALYLTQRYKNILVKIIIILLAGAFATLTNIDYGAYGIWMIASCFVILFKPILGGFLFVGTSMFNALMVPLQVGLIQLYSIIALPLMYCYNGKQGIKISKWWFYWFYPAHLLILCGLHVLLYGV